MAEEYLEDISGSEALKLEWGDRFRGWYKTIKFDRTEALKIGDLEYRANVCDFQFRFIMPSRIEFFKGIGSEGNLEYGCIDYSQAERLLGVFRYPLSAGGFFASPIKLLDKESEIKDFNKNLLNLSPEEIIDLIKNKKVITFEAFRLPFFGFQFLNLIEKDFKEISNLAGKSVSTEIQGSYETEISGRISTVKEKILSQPNILLILQNILDRKLQEEKEIALMTNNIIHFGI